MPRWVPTALVLSLLPALAGAEIRLFDMGPAGSPAWPGATAVTETDAYSPGTGFGWMLLPGLEAIRRPVADDLGGDFVRGPGVFRVDTGPERQRVWVLLRDSGHGINAPRFWVEPYSISANGDTVVDAEQSRETFLPEYLYSNWDADWDLGQSLFDKYMAKYDRVHEFDVMPEDGCLAIAFSQHCPVAAMAVWPAVVQLEARALIAGLQGAREAQFNDSFDAESLSANLRPGVYSKRDRKREYVVWPRRCEDKVYPHAEPTSSVKRPRLEAVAFPDEYEPLSFCVRPLKSLQEVAVTVTDLRGPRGAVLSGDAVDVALVKYVERATGQGKYLVEPRELLPARPRDLPSAVTRQYWVTVRVPDDAPPGIYRGTVVVAPAGKQATSMPLQLTVLAATLGPPGMATGMYYYAPDSTDLRSFRDGSLSPEAAGLLRRQLTDMREHGMTTVAVAPPWYLVQLEDGELVYNEQAWSFFDGFFRLYKEAGFTEPVPAYQLANILMMPLPGRPVVRGEGAWEPGNEFDPEFQRLYAQAIRMFYARASRAREEGRWPEVILYASDELSNYGARGGEWGLRHISLLHEIRPSVPGGFRVCASMNGPQERDMAMKLDVAIPNHAFPLNAETFRSLKAVGVETWLYNVGWERFTWGHYPALVGAKGRLQWHYHTNPTGTHDPHNRLTSGSWGVAMGPDGPLRSVDWELTREGIDDARLVNTLRSLIARAREADLHSPALDAAEADLEWLAAQVDPALTRRTEGGGFWGSGMYGKLKRMLGRDCVELEKALSRGLDNRPREE